VLVTRRFGLATVSIAAASAALVLSASATAAPTPQPAVDSSCLLTMRCGGEVAWPSTNGPVTGGRFSPLTQINLSTVRRLKVAWTLSEPNVPAGTEAYPVVVDGTAYVTSAFDHVYAINAATGKLLWTYVPKYTPSLNWGLAANRGVAVGGGRVYLLTLDCQLVALDAATGREEYARTLCNPKVGYSESTAPIYYDGVLYIGSSGSDNGTRGFEEARLASNGQLLWQFWTVPKRGAPGSWLPKANNHGGGDVWFVPTLDPAAGVMFFGTGNPSPDFWGQDRPGPDPYTDSVVALNMRTGKFLWAMQEVPHDLWDYDAASPPVLFHTQAGLGVGEAGKDGVWYEMSAKTGQLLNMPQAFVPQVHPAPPVNGKPVLISAVGSEWSPVPYDPQTGLVYVSAMDSMSLVRAKEVKHGPYAYDFGTAFLPTPSYVKSTGSITAFNVGTGTIAWVHHESTPMIGGSSATAGGLVFTAVSGTGVAQALDARTGKLVWSARLGKAVASAPSIYEIGGKEYVLYALGGSLLSNSYPHELHASTPEFVAFSLGG
jgi:alcohol dehydrogenase (cytochrome c)